MGNLSFGIGQGRVFSAGGNGIGYVRRRMWGLSML